MDGSLIQTIKNSAVRRAGSRTYEESEEPQNNTKGGNQI